MANPRTSVPPVGATEGKGKNQVTETIIDKVNELTEKELAALAEADLGTVFVGDDGLEKVLIAKEWLDQVEERLLAAERPVLVKVKDAVLSHKRQVVLGVSSVLALSAAAYVATHREEVLEAIEHTTEAATEGVELSAQDVKKTARKARTGSTTK
jgi:hypothetical protein